MPLHFFQVDLQNRKRLFWQAQLAGWGVVTIIPLLFFYITDVSIDVSVAISFTRAISCLLLSSLLLRPLLRWIRRRRISLAPTGLLILGSGIALGWLDMLLVLALTSMLGMHTTTLPLYIEETWLIRAFLFWVWAILYFSIHYWLNTQETRLRMAQLQTEQRTIELQQLRAQMSPMFLFHAFHTLLAEAENPQVVTRLTKSMGEFLRFSLMKKGTLQELGLEVEALKHYLRVEKLRLKDRFDYHIAASKQACDQRVPVMLIQPLLENAIYFGQRTCPSPLRLKIEAKIYKNELWITVGNSGRWIPRPSSDTQGTGLASLQRRLKLAYAGKASCAHEEKEGWVYVHVRIPVGRTTIAP